VSLPGRHRYESAEYDRRHGVREYVWVIVVLAVITAFEIVAILPETKQLYEAHLPWILPWIVPMLLLLAIAKFFGVAYFYMHLKQDRGSPRLVFVGPLAIAAVIVVVLMALNGQFTG